MRLNKQIRETILENAIKKSGIHKRAEALIAERVEIAEKLRRSIISEEFEKKVETLKVMFEEVREVLPDVDLNYLRNNAVRVNFRGQSYDLAFNGKHHGLYRDGLVTTNNSVWKIAKRVGRTAVEDDFGFFDNDQKCNDLCKEYESLQVDIRAILSKCSTEKQLLDVWPESSELIPEGAKKTGTALMVDTSKLNSALGLPSETPTT